MQIQCVNIQICAKNTNSRQKFENFKSLKNLVLGPLLGGGGYYREGVYFFDTPREGALIIGRAFNIGRALIRDLRHYSVFQAGSSQNPIAGFGNSGPFPTEIFGPIGLR